MLNKLYVYIIYVCVYTYIYVQFIYIRKVYTVHEGSQTNFSDMSVNPAAWLPSPMLLRTRKYVFIRVFVFFYTFKALYLCHVFPNNMYIYALFLCMYAVLVLLIINVNSWGNITYCIILTIIIQSTVSYSTILSAMYKLRICSSARNRITALQGR